MNRKRRLTKSWYGKARLTSYELGAASYELKAWFIVFIICTNDTKQIYVTYRELNDDKVALINGKISNILGVINLNEIKNWEYIKGKSLWVNVNFNGLEEAKSTDHFCFLSKTL